VLPYQSEKSTPPLRPRIGTEIQEALLFLGVWNYMAPIYFGPKLARSILLKALWSGGMTEGNNFPPGGLVAKKFRHVIYLTPNLSPTR
jgi:hypothetical protein